MDNKFQKISGRINIVLDTSIFVNPDSRFVFGKNADDAFFNFLREAVSNKNLDFFMPPSVYEELAKFLRKKPSPEESILINKKPPASYEYPVSAIIVYELIEEIRYRVNKGLRIAEKYACKASASREDTIKTLRGEFRAALREGIIDSKEDFDLILLAKSLDARLATSDKGLIKWAAKLGIASIDSRELKEMLLKP